MTTAQKMVVNAQRIATPVPLFNCPTRRRNCVEISPSNCPFNSNQATMAAKTDYGANAAYPYADYPSRCKVRATSLRASPSPPR